MTFKKIALTGLVSFQILQAPLALVMAEEVSSDEETTEEAALEDTVEEEVDEEDVQDEEGAETSDDEDESDDDTEDILVVEGSILEGEERERVLDEILARDDAIAGYEAYASGDLHLMNETKVFTADLDSQVDESDANNPMTVVTIDYVIYDEGDEAGDPVEVKLYVDKDFLFIEREDGVQKLPLNHEDGHQGDPQSYRSALRTVTYDSVVVTETEDTYHLYVDYLDIDLDEVVDLIFDEDEVGEQYDEIIAELDQVGSDTDRDKFIEDARLRTKAMAELILSSVKEQNANYDKESYELISQHFVFDLDSEKLQELVGMIALVDPDEVSLSFEVNTTVTSRGETIDHSTFPNADDVEDLIPSNDESTEEKEASEETSEKEEEKEEEEESKEEPSDDNSKESEDTEEGTPSDDNESNEDDLSDLESEIYYEGDEDE